MTLIRHSADTYGAALLLALATAGVLASCSSPTATAGAGPTAGAATAAPPAPASPAGSGTTGPGTGTTVEACSLLTDADIKEITGFDVAEVIPDPADTTFPSACEWRVEGAAWQVVLGVSSPGGQATWNSLVPYTQGEAVTGIGDEAFLAEAGGDLMVRRGDTFFDIQYVAVGEPLGTLDRLAKRVLENLP